MVIKCKGFNDAAERVNRMLGNSFDGSVIRQDVRVIAHNKNNYTYKYAFVIGTERIAFYYEATCELSVLNVFKKYIYAPAFDRETLAYMFGL